jgi:hypothetical protein
VSDLVYDVESFWDRRTIHPIIGSGTQWINLFDGTRNFRNDIDTTYPEKPVKGDRATTDISISCFSDARPPSDLTFIVDGVLE